MNVQPRHLLRREVHAAITYDLQFNAPSVFLLARSRDLVDCAPRLREICRINFKADKIHTEFDARERAMPDPKKRIDDEARFFQALQANAHLRDFHREGRGMRTLAARSRIVG